jgi:enoyl-CoA hydratase/carnithine racemase
MRDNCGDVGAVVVTGSGKAFSAGGDLAFLRRRSEDSGARNSNIMFKFYERFLCVRKLPVPVIAAINGAAIGAGACFATACDMRVAAAGAKIGFTFPTLGLHPGM